MIHGKSYIEHGEHAISQVFDELSKAEKKHPGWPEDKIHAVAIMIEEAGEAMQAAIDCVYAGGSIAHLRKELAQTGAMAIRALLHLDDVRWYCQRHGFTDNRCDCGAGTEQVRVGE